MASEDKFSKMARELATMESMFESLDIITRQKVLMQNNNQYNFQQCMLSMYMDLDDMKETSNYILANSRDHPSLRHKAADFKFRVLDASDSVFSEITADPVFHCMIEHMKKAKYSRDEEATNCGGEEDVCVICLDAFDESIDLDIQTECGHRFHDRCIYGWINSGRSTCPMCRFNVL
ncbi:hypothetical protein Syun_021412 [Stephania yunnanensis]|uniref:RING-type E3 ubiquitin transferase n=1 Tax=Stephania yunnanensis TaxID=152371 RepID=A0AAP0IGC2_9MAGN